MTQKLYIYVFVLKFSLYWTQAYAKLTSALTLLGRGPNILDQLLMHFTLTIHNLSLVTVAKHGQHGEPGKKQYADLCQAVNEDRSVSICRKTPSIWVLII